jgi:hypothetical protein
MKEATQRKKQTLSETDLAEDTPPYDHEDGVFPIQSLFSSRVKPDFLCFSFRKKAESIPFREEE